MNLFLAALRGLSDSPQVPDIRDIAPPVEPPYPVWMIIAGAAAGLVVLGLLAWLIVHLSRRKPAIPPPTPREVALRRLEELRSQVRVLDPYAFSFAVSDVLRHFVSAYFRLRAEQQTSREFLDAIQHSPEFSAEDRRLLADFLEQCDLIKFARIQADHSTSEALLSSAFAFVQGGRL